jgi:hypothetical protein
MPVCYSDITKGEREIRRKTTKNIHLFRNLKEENIMNHKRNLTRGFTLILVMLVVAGCTAPTATPCPTTVPQSCPTVALQECPTAAIQSCPTTAAQAMPEMNAYRKMVNGNANVIFTFDPGDKCSMQIIRKPYTSDFSYEIVVNDNSHLNYILSGMTLRSGYTIADVQEWAQKNPNSTTPPPMMTMKIYEDANPMSNTIQLVQYTGDPIYFTCLTEGPDAQQVIADFDPLVMPTK